MADKKSFKDPFPSFDGSNGHFFTQKEIQKKEKSFYRLLSITAAVWLLIMILLFYSCISSQTPATLSIGTVIQVDGDRVLVTFPVVNKEFSDQAANWFYIPGHSYLIRDQYPNPSKDPNLK